MRKELMLLVLGMLLTMQPVMAVVINETCLNDTHVREYATWNETINGVTDTYEYISIMECSQNCSNNHCVGTSTESSLTPVVASAFAALVFIYLGLNLRLDLGITDPQMRRFSTTGVKLIFFLFGVSLLLLTVSLAYNMSITSRESSNTIDLMETLTTRTALMFYLLVFFIMLLFFVSVMLWWPRLVQRQGREMDRTERVVNGKSRYRR